MLKQVSKDICVYSYLMLYPNTGGVYSPSYKESLPKKKKKRN